MNTEENNALARFKEEMTQLSAAVKGLKDALIGDELRPNGLVKKVDYLTSRMRKIEYLLAAAFLLAGGQAAEVILKYIL